MNNIRLSVMFAAAALFVLMLFQRIKDPANEEFPGLTHPPHFDHAEAVVDNVERIKPGNTRQVVKRLLGEADSVADREWAYNLDEHSGYIVNFDSADRVVSVHAWLS